MHIVDSHCHLDDERLFENLSDILARAENADIKTLQTICTRRQDFPIIKNIAEQYENIYCSFGIHPHHADEDIITEDEIKTACQHAKVIGVGETGLDYYYENSPKKEQRESFIKHIRAARALDLPVIIHTRDAEEDTMAIMDDMRAEGSFKALFHCFSSSMSLAEYGIENGVYFSASGIVTFKKSYELQEVFKRVPDEKIMVETDAPYLAPVPKRGKTCEPAYTAYTAQFIADLRGQTLENFAKITTTNFYRLFSKARNPLISSE